MVTGKPESTASVVDVLVDVELEDGETLVVVAAVTVVVVPSVVVVSSLPDDEPHAATTSTRATIKNRNLWYMDSSFCRRSLHGSD
jgi:hypothetical protein